jgi:hypothetical protein
MIELNLLRDMQDDTTSVPSPIYRFYCTRCDAWHPWGKCEAQDEQKEDVPTPERRGLWTLQEFLGNG